MSVHLSNFLIEVSENPALLHQLRMDPETVREDAGLSSKELTAILSEDQGLISSLFATSPPIWPVHLLPPRNPEEDAVQLD